MGYSVGMEDDQKRAAAMFDIAPAGWDKSALSIVHEIREMIRPITDRGSSMDTGGGDGSGDLWFTVSGVEYIMEVRPNRRPN